MFQLNIFLLLTPILQLLIDRWHSNVKDNNNDHALITTRKTSLMTTLSGEERLYSTICRHIASASSYSS